MFLEAQMFSTPNPIGISIWTFVTIYKGNLICKVLDLNRKYLLYFLALNLNQANNVLNCITDFIFHIYSWINTWESAREK